MTQSTESTPRAPAARRRRGLVIGAGAGALVLAAGGVGAWLLLRGDDAPLVSAYDATGPDAVEAAPEQAPEERWSLPLEGHGPVSLGEDRLAYLEGEEEARVVSADDGSVQELTLPPELAAPSVIWSDEEGTLLLGLEAGVTGWLAHDDLEVVWSAEASPYSLEPDDDVVLVLDGTVPVDPAADVDEPSPVSARDLRTGEVLWERELITPVLAGDTVHTVLDGELTALDSRSGEERWAADVGDVELWGTAAQDVVVVLTDGGAGTAAYTTDGEEVFSADGVAEQAWRVAPDRVLVAMDGTLRLVDPTGVLAEREVSDDTVTGGRFSGLRAGEDTWVVQATIDGEPVLLDESLRTVHEGHVTPVRGGGILAVEDGVISRYDAPGGDPLWSLDQPADTVLTVVAGGLYLIGEGPDAQMTFLR